jgi:hypothetical protein
LASFQDELPQALSIEPARIVSQIIKQFTEVRAVVLQRAIAGPTLLAHPQTERSEQDWVLDSLHADRACEHTGTPEIVDEQAHAIPQISAAIPRTLASVQMMGKLFNELLVERANRSAFLRGPIDEVFRSSNVPSNPHLCVAGLTQLSSKPFNQWAIRAVAEFPDTKSRVEKLCKHDILLRVVWNTERRHDYAESLRAAVRHFCEIIVRG